MAGPHRFVKGGSNKKTKKTANPAAQPLSGPDFRADKPDTFAPFHPNDLKFRLFCCIFKTELFLTSFHSERRDHEKGSGHRRRGLHRQRLLRISARPRLRSHDFRRAHHGPPRGGRSTREIHPRQPGRPRAHQEGLPRRRIRRGHALRGFQPGRRINAESVQILPQQPRLRHQPSRSRFRSAKTTGRFRSIRTANRSSVSRRS